MNGVEEVARRLSFYHSLFLGCLIGMIVFLGISVLLFLRFEIRSTLRLWFRKPIKAGKKKKKRPVKMQKKPWKNEEQKTTQLAFRVEQEIMWIHTEEEEF